MKPTIGIIGGSGPLATIDIEQKILSATQKQKCVLTDQDYFNLIVFNYCGTHDRNDSVFFGKPDPLNQYIRYLSSISSLGVDLILLACNTAHMYLSVLQEKTEIPVISIMEKVLEHLSNHFPSCSRVGLISTKATAEKKLYHHIFSANQIDTFDISASTQSLIMEAIYLIKSGIRLNHDESFIKNTCLHSRINSDQVASLKTHPHKYVLLQEKVPNPTLIIEEAIEELVRNGCQHIVFGCTELPLAIPYLKKHPSIHFIDPNAIVAEAIVEQLQGIEHQITSNLNIKSKERRFI